jgi:hypothetical protein
VWKGDVSAAFTMHTYFEASSSRGLFRECGALAAIFEDGKILYADSDPCAGGPM